MRHILLLLTILPYLTQAQVTDTTKKDSTKTHLVIGATYNSGMNYYGRVDSLKSSGMYPFVGIAFKNGLYVNSTFVFIHNSLTTEYAATLLEAGYNFKNKQGNWAGTLSAARYFYQTNTGLVESAIKEVASASITNLNKVLDVTVGVDTKFSNEADPGAQAGLDHIIKFIHLFNQKDVLVLDPSAYVYAGTQSFTQTYYQEQHFLIFPTGEQAITQNSRKFGVLAYEASLPIVYAYKKLNLILSPAYILPENVIAPESANNLFYITATVKFTL